MHLTRWAGAAGAALGVALACTGVAQAAPAGGPGPYPDCLDAVKKYELATAGGGIVGGPGGMALGIANTYQDMINKCPPYPIDATVD
jgi:hypothetical protein